MGTITELRILGPPQLLSDGLQIDAVAPGLMRVLVRLALGGTSGVDAAVAADDLGVSSGALRVAVSRLRKTVPGAVVTSGSRYRIDGVLVDAYHFEQAVASIDSLPAAEIVALLDGALEMWHGAAIEGLEHEAWAQPRAVFLNELRTRAREKRLRTKLDLERHAEAIAEAQSLIDAEPIRDDPHALLMQALAGAGRRAEALRHYRRYRSFLAEEVGIEPGKAIRRLDAEIASEGAADEHEPVRSAQPLERTEVGQAALDGATTEFRPFRSLDYVPNNLPRLRSAFVGREREIETIVKDLATWPLVTLTGVGGVGKTRLGLQVAARVLPGFRGGVYFVELAPVMQGSDVVAALIDAIEPPQLPGRDNVSALVDHLASHPVLVVIDNCEHVIDSVADIVDQIMAHADQTRILATSREGLGLEGERLRLVQPLEAGNGQREGPAEQLFKLRLAASEPDLELDHEHKRLVRLICERLDGVPLALELAAARASAMSLGDILDRLQQRFELLRIGRRAVSERHQTLRNTVEWSHDLLDEPSQQLFARLSVFVGTFGLDSVEQLCAEDVDAADIADTMSALVSKSMVEAIRLPNRPLRYRLLETLRQYAAEQLDATGDPGLWRNRHAELVAQLVVDLGAQLRTRDELAAMTRLLEEVPNIRSALLSASAANRPDLAAKLTGPTGLRLDTTQTFSSLANVALQIGAGSDPDWGHGVLISEIWNCYAHADEVRAQTALTKLQAIETHRPDLPAVKALGAGVVAFTSGDFALGIEQFAAAHQAAAKADEYTQLWCALVLTAYSSAQQRPDLEVAEFAVKVARRLEVPTTLSFALCTNSMVHELSDPEHSLSLIDEALAIDVLPGSISGMRHVMRSRILFRQRRWAEAISSTRPGVEELARAGTVPEGSHCLALGAACLHLLGEHETGADLFRRSAASTDVQMVKLYRDIEEQAAGLIGEPFPPRRPQTDVPFHELAQRAITAFDKAATP